MESEPFLTRAENDEGDSLWFGPEGAIDEDDQPDLMVYFVPGNPCLISYYGPFLSHLSTQLNSNGKKQGKAIVGGFTLPGFQSSQPATIKGTLPAGLNDQILNVEELIRQARAKHCSTTHKDGTGKRTKTVLMSHSVGSYMTLEILRRRAKHLNQMAAMDIVGAVLLFPTVTEIAQSRNGTISSILLYTPFFPAIVAYLSHMLTFLISISTLSKLISYLGRVPPHIGDATAKFLKSPLGVYQALYLTIDEMAMIRHDTWDETIWGSSQLAQETSRPTIVPLRFYFGEQDVWVSSKARDQLIARRARQESEGRDSTKPVMVIDKENIPHGFVISHSGRMAEKAKSMIEDLINLTES